MQSANDSETDSSDSRRGRLHRGLCAASHQCYAQRLEVLPKALKAMDDHSSTCYDTLRFKYFSRTSIAAVSRDVQVSQVPTSAAGLGGQRRLAWGAGASLLKPSQCLARQAALASRPYIRPWTRAMRFGRLQGHRPMSWCRPAAVVRRRLGRRWSQLRST